MNVLIVDDERFNLVMAKDIIETYIENVEVLLCKLPEEVMGILADNDIDIVLLDIIMPKINGIDVLKDIRSIDKYQDIQVIMFTGVTDKESFKNCFKNGADDYINKPIDITEFTARLDSAVKTRKYIRRLKNMYEQMAEQYDELQDVTQKLKHAQFHMIQQEKLASLGEIAAGVAHEINNPIGFVSSNLKMMEKYLAKIKAVFAVFDKFIAIVDDEQLSRKELLEAKCLIEEIKKKEKIDVVLEDLEPIIMESIEGVDRVSKIVKGLRSFARTGTEDEMNMQDLNQIVEEALLIIKNDLKYTVSIEKKMSPVPTIVCNRGQIGQVLINILINATQAIKNQKRDGLGKITIETDQNDEYVVCKISDDGPGIDPEIASKIFDPFFTTKELGSGVGLGLSISYGIIKNHGGDLRVDSEYGNGATFIIKLPYKVEV